MTFNDLMTCHEGNYDFCVFFVFFFPGNRDNRFGDAIV